MTGDLIRTKCKDCPDGQLWDKKGPTQDACPTCGGEAFIWVSESEDSEDTNVEDSDA